LKFFKDASAVEYKLLGKLFFEPPLVAVLGRREWLLYVNDQQSGSIVFAVFYFGKSRAYGSLKRVIVYQPENNRNYILTIVKDTSLDVIVS
jgi:hypothetical protein